MIPLLIFLKKHEYEDIVLQSVYFKINQNNKNVHIFIMNMYKFKLYIVNCFVYVEEKWLQTSVYI